MVLTTHRLPKYLFALCALVATAGLGGLSPVVVRGQSASPQQAPAFEVASVRQNKEKTGRQSYRNLPGGKFVVTRMPLRGLIRIAYGPERFKKPSDQIVGGPEWLDSDMFDIEAQAPSEHDPDPNVALARSFAMLRTLIEERFKLKTHFENREMQLFHLVMARPDRRLGPQLKPSTLDCEAGRAAGAAPEQRCGLTSAGPGKITARGVTIPEIASYLQLSPAVAKLVYDQTKLDGRFDAHIEFTPPFILSAGGTVPNPAAETGVSLPTALEDQLGLKLQALKGPVEVLVVDSATRLAGTIW